ncbi:hypothetical protein NEF87_001449 [Candidatus Lokiarchaeum ossiferum]|uniref:Uncharacterized protein n=1 Tax=Candidatus Lokiarchaeum ossiferum TaxID=2951803 RepID=A0ABY6HRR8_9ARCH|nr:hypothetical protein NEF87_001449 [Candidatus Lokiarchaeum sp. B-35]
MITSNVEPLKYQEEEIFTCITFSSTKLGPRLVGNASDWGLKHFSKETLFSVIHDSLLIRSPKALLFINNVFGESFRIYVLKYNRRFYDYRYQGDSFSICVFVPSSFKGIVQLDKSIESFDWTQFISSSGSIEKLVEELHKKMHMK